MCHRSEIIAKIIPLIVGEIGCFMSHYSIWVQMLKKNYTEVIVFEDDLNIQPKFKERLSEVRNELDYMKWDFIFIGRQISE